MLREGTDVLVGQGSDRVPQELSVSMLGEVTAARPCVRDTGRWPGVCELSLTVTWGAGGDGENTGTLPTHKHVGREKKNETASWSVLAGA